MSNIKEAIDIVQKAAIRASVYTVIAVAILALLFPEKQFSSWWKVLECFGALTLMLAAFEWLDRRDGKDGGGPLGLSIKFSIGASRKPASGKSTEA